MGKTVAAVIKLIDQFSAPSKEVIRQSKDLEKRFKDIGNTFKNVGTVFEGVGTGLTKTVTAPIAAVGAASMAAFNEVDAGLDTIIQKTGASGKALDAFQTNFENVATTVPANLGDVGAAIGEINTRLGLTGKPLENATEQFIKFAQLNGTDVESAIQTVTRAMGDAGIAAEDYSSILDQLNVAGQVSGISVDALAENLAKYGAPMRALGIDTKNSIAMFAGWEKAGVNTEIAFSGMKKAISNWGKDGKDAGKEFQKVMQQIKDAPDISNATALAIEAFGAKAGPDLADAIRGGRFEVGEYVKALEASSGSVTKTFAGTADGVDKFKTASNAAKIALSQFGGIMSNAVAPILDKATEKIKEVTKWFKSLSPEMQQSIAKFALLAAAVGPMLIGFGKAVTGVGSMITTFGKLTSAGMKVASTIKNAGGVIGLATSPVGIAIAAVVGLIAIGIALYKNWDTIKETLSKAWDSIKQKFTDLGKSFSEFGEQLKTSFLEGWEAFKTGVVERFTAIYDGAKEKIELVKETLVGIGDFIKGTFTETWSKAWDGLKNIVSKAFGALEGLVKTPINAVVGIVNNAIDGINSIKFTVPDWVPGLGGKGWNGLGIPHIPTLATGSDYWRGGMVQVHEKGGEIIDLPKGSRVYPHDESVRMARQEAVKSFSVTIAKLADQIIVREEADIDKIANALANKLEQTRLNMV